MITILALLTDVLLQEALSMEILTRLEATPSLFNHPAVFYGGSVNGAMSNVKKVTISGWGADAFAPVDEGDDVDATDVNHNSVLVEVGRLSLRRDWTALSQMVYASREALINAVATDVVGGAINAFNALIATTGASFTTTVGTTGTVLTIAKFNAAKGTLTTAGAKGPYVAILHGRQYTDLSTELLSATGVIQWIPATVELIQAKGPGYVGTLLGVDVYVDNSVPLANSGADRAGCMFSTGGIVYADGIDITAQAVQDLPNGTKVTWSAKHDNVSAKTSFVGDMYVGAEVGEQARGVRVLSDA